MWVQRRVSGVVVPGVTVLVLQGVETVGPVKDDSNVTILPYKRLDPRTKVKRT